MDEPGAGRVLRIPAGKLDSIRPHPTISLFNKTDKSSAVQLIDGKFPRDAAMIFCKRVRRELIGRRSKSFTVTGGDVTALKGVLDWINQCINEQSIVKYRDLANDTPKPFTAYANVIISATHLGIPALDLAEGLVKRMQAMARKVLMSWDEVEWFYTHPALDSCDNTVRQVAAASVFWAWWNHKLDESDTSKDMLALGDLRKQIPELDEDLHDWCARNEADVRKKWEENKKVKRVANSRRRGSEVVTDATRGRRRFSTPAGVGPYPGIGRNNDSIYQIVKDNGFYGKLGGPAGPTFSPEPADPGVDSGIDVDTGKSTTSATFDPDNTHYFRLNRTAGDWAEEASTQENVQSLH